MRGGLHAGRFACKTLGVGLPSRSMVMDCRSEAQYGL